MMINLCNSTIKAATKLEKDLSAEFVHPTKDSSFSLDADKEAIRHAIGLAFAGNESVPGEPMMEWALSHHKFASQEERVALVRFCMSYGLIEDLNCIFVLS